MKYIKTYESKLDEVKDKIKSLTMPDVGDFLLCVYSNIEYYTMGELYEIVSRSASKITYKVLDNKTRPNKGRFFGFNDDTNSFLRQFNYPEENFVELTTDKSLEEYKERIEMEDNANKYNL